MGENGVARLLGENHENHDTGKINVVNVCTYLLLSQKLLLRNKFSIKTAIFLVFARVYGGQTADLSSNMRKP